MSQASSALPVQNALGEGEIDLASLTAQLPVDVRARLEVQEMAWYQAALQRASNNKTEAAKLLNLPRKTFDNRLGNLSDQAKSKI
nr:hypothetical protein KXZ65_04860 [Pectobacterium sp. PL152]